jgi:hypothetical protein
VKANQATGSHQPSGAPERRSRIGEEHQNKPADSSVEPIGDVIKCLRIALDEANIGETGLRNPSRGRGHRFRLAFNTNDFTLAPDKPCRKHRNIASTRAQIQHPHPISETRGAKDTFSQGIKQLGLAGQTPVLKCSVSERIL